MNILFIHNNYPAQFKYLCSQMSSSNKHRIIFLTANKVYIQNHIKNLQVKSLKLIRINHPPLNEYLRHIEGGFINAQATMNALKDLKKENFIPELIITYGGRGFGLFLRDLFPKSKIIGYFEWWLKSETAKYMKKNFSIKDSHKINLRNMLILQELELCDAAIVPTQWQKSQFPATYHKKLKVIFDGIDTNFFHSASKDFKKNILSLKNQKSGETFQILPSEKIISYATRGMEPLRGFPEFINALPSTFSRNKNLKVVIAGKDCSIYSYPAPSHNGSWKQYLMEKINNHVVKENIYFTGTLSYNDYRNLLWRSNLHCYFTRPYITSWSFFEAISCGANILTNRCEATEGIAEEGSISWTNINNQDEINQSIQYGLDPVNQLKSKLNPRYNLESCLKEWQDFLNTLITSK